VVGRFASAGLHVAKAPAVHKHGNG
jgi:hypothetical protein